MAEQTLNENGKLVCMMAATMVSGIVANPAYNREPIQPYEMLRLATDLVSLALSQPELRE